MLNITPTPWTAALAGLFSALALPLLRGWFGGGSDAGLNVPFLFALILTVAVPAHAFVLGIGPSATPGARALDKALLTRIGAWLVAAAAATGLRTAL